MIFNTTISISATLVGLHFILCDAMTCHSQIHGNSRS